MLVNCYQLAGMTTEMVCVLSLNRTRISNQRLMISTTDAQEDRLQIFGQISMNLVAQCQLSSASPRKRWNYSGILEIEAVELDGRDFANLDLLFWIVMIEIEIVAVISRITKRSSADRDGWWRWCKIEITCKQNWWNWKQWWNIIQVIMPNHKQKIHRADLLFNIEIF